MHASDMAFYSRYMADMERTTELGFSEMLRESKKLSESIDAEVDQASGAISFIGTDCCRV